MRLLDTILDIVFPVSCISCGKNGSDLCKKCISEFPQAERECANWVFPIFDYRHPPIKKAVGLLKYKGKRRLAGVFAEILHGRILEELADLSQMENFREAILIPIPLARKRKRERGFNQAELICEKLIGLDSKPAHPHIRYSVYASLEKNVLIKIKETENQARIKDRNKRLKNLVGAFAVKNAEGAQKIKDRNIILVDDVSTTGATLSEARKTLKSAGARKIIAFTVAH
jgi:ComF family protein